MTKNIAEDSQATHFEQFADGISTVNGHLNELSSRLNALVRRIGSPESMEPCKDDRPIRGESSAEECGLHSKFVERMRVTAQTCDDISRQIRLLEKSI